MDNFGAYLIMRSERQMASKFIVNSNSYHNKTRISGKHEYRNKIEKPISRLA